MNCRGARLHLTNLPETPLTKFVSVLLEPHCLSPLAAALHCANGAGIPWHDASFWMGFLWKARRILVLLDPEPGSGSAWLVIML